MRRPWVYPPGQGPHRLFDYERSFSIVDIGAAAVSAALSATSLEISHLPGIPVWRENCFIYRRISTSSSRVMGRHSCKLCSGICCRT